MKKFPPSLLGSETTKYVHVPVLRTLYTYFHGNFSSNDLALTKPTNKLASIIIYRHAHAELLQ